MTAWFADSTREIFFCVCERETMRGKLCQVGAVHRYLCPVLALTLEHRQCHIADDDKEVIVLFFSTWGWADFDIKKFPFFDHLLGPLCTLFTNAICI